jgi:2-dehydro-3-deoxyphosphogluconate aldolase/(4S)-4-hydroxy-2-oxoglutarate aldolase
MVRFDRMTVLQAILDIGAVPTFTPRDLESAWRVVSACRHQGATVIEITNRRDDTLDIFRQLVARARSEAPEIIMGAGTIYDAPTAALFLANGARFVVSPVLNADVARLCNRRKTPYLPGCSTATEISQAEELGVEIVKLFPAAALDGPAFIRAILGPSPWSRLMPTNVDATEEATNVWFRSGAACLGVGPSLISDALQADPNVAHIEAKIGEFLGWVRSARLVASSSEPERPPRLHK